MFVRMKAKTAAIWAERIEEWGRSGQSATEFAEGKPYTGGTLSWAASQLRKDARDKGKGRSPRPVVEPKQKIRIAEIVRRPSRVAVADGLGLVVEIAGARVSLRLGFDQTLLRDVVHALRGAQ